MDIDTTGIVLNYTSEVKPIVKITLPEKADGYFVVNIGDTQYVADLSKGVSEIDSSKLSVGNHSVNITYLGSDSYNGFNVVINLVVEKNALEPTVDGDKVNITLPSDATGSVNITIGGVNYTASIVNGSIVCDALNSLDAGEHDVRISYSGDDNYPAMTYSTSVSVAKSTPTMTIQTNAITEGEIDNIVINLPSKAGGYVLVTINNQKYYADVVNGLASVSVYGLSAGSQVVLVNYSGDSNYISIVNTATLTVNNAPIVPPALVKVASKIVASKKHLKLKSNLKNTL